MLRLRLTCVLLLAAALSAGIAYSQLVSATIVGSVTDSSGAAVANAKITLTETNTGVDRASLSNPSGNFTYPNLPPGRYRITVETAGFKKEIRDGINLDVDSTSRVDLKLTPGAVHEIIEVTAEAAVLKTDRADITTTVDAVQIQELPNLNNGNYQLMLSLVPGVSEPTEQHSAFFNAAGSVQMNSYGQPRMANNYQVEGIDNNERTGLLQIMIPPKEAIQQVSVSTSNHDPELGRGSGASQQCRAQERHQSVSRRSLLEPAKQRHQQPQFLQSGGGTHRLQPGGRKHRRPDPQEQTLLLHGLPEDHGSRGQHQPDQRSFHGISCR